MRGMIGGLLWIAMIFCDVPVKEGYNEWRNGVVDLRESVAVGIDLGTTYSCVCVWKPSTKDTEFVYAESGEQTSPSVVNFKKETDSEGKMRYEAVAGWPGMHTYNEKGNANTYFYAFKRAMGIDDLSNIDTKVEEIKNNASVPIFVENVGGKRRVAYKLQEEESNEYQSVTPEELSRYVLSMLKNYILKDYKIEGLTITVPAYFNLNQQSATIEAAKLAGFPIPKIWKEPAAAALAYTHDLIKKGVLKKDDNDFNEMNICVFDLGGGTFDVSIVEPSKGLMLVPVYGGDNYLGGENVNDNLTNYFADYIKKQVGFDVMHNQNVKLRLRNIVEGMKIELCNKVRESPGRKSNEMVSSPFIYEGEKSIELRLSNEKFNELNEGFYVKIRNVMNKMLSNNGKESGGYDKNSVHRVLLVGGSTRIPKVIDIVEEIFGANKIHYEGVDADTIVARGAALHTAGEIGMLGDDEKIQTVDSIPLSLGICTEEDHFEQIIAKGEFIPAQGSKEFTTASDNQTKVRIRLAQGGMESFKENVYIGDIEFDLPGNQPKGGPRIEVTIDMNANGEIKLSAEDKQTGSKKDARFDSNVAKMTPQDIKRMEERLYSEENKELKEKREVIKRFEYILDITDKGEDFKRIPDEVKKDAVEHIAKMKLWLEKNKESLSRVEIEYKLQQFVDEMKGYVPGQAVVEEVPSQPVPEEKETGREEL